MNHKLDRFNPLFFKVSSPTPSIDSTDDRGERGRCQAITFARESVCCGRVPLAAIVEDLRVQVRNGSISRRKLATHCVLIFFIKAASTCVDVKDGSRIVTPRPPPATHH
ncbi:hypothetical protein C0Q70_02624 [Pomacea canaliculata]|uniref:Uncharacterized protein n=1 Tax=Pomacea canaliculata TaxID=400727 RepID=A0A2T7PQF7_POMCA|nr:hypothetical protein C0Q70_02624 [Pomacea canaliculata]